MDDIARDSDVTNEDRAAWAAGAVRTFQRATGTDDESAISDLLADMMHLADSRGESWDGLIANAEMHYNAEKVDA